MWFKNLVKINKLIFALLEIMWYLCLMNEAKKKRLFVNSVFFILGVTFMVINPSFIFNYGVVLVSGLNLLIEE